MTGKSEVCAGVILGLFLAGSAAAAEDVSERLLFGFEKAECEKVAAGLKKVKNAFKPLDNGDFILMPPQGCEFPHVIAGILPMQCVQSEATQGKYSLRVPNNVRPDWAGMKEHFLYVNPREVLPELAQDLRVNLRLPELFNTHNWFSREFPEDWSGWDLLRVDVKAVHDRPVTMLVEVEDELVEPPVSQTYSEIKPDTWVTLEMDLGKAVEERKLDLTKMRNIFIRFDGRKDIAQMTGKERPKELLARVAVYVDNIRLCRKGAACKTPVLQGERSVYTQRLPRAYAVDLVWESGNVEGTLASEPVPAPTKPAGGSEAVAMYAPATIEIMPLLRKGLDQKGASKDVKVEDLHKCVELQMATAGDGRAMMVCFAMPMATRLMKFDKPFTWHHGPMAVVVTTDGGKTWGGFAGPGEVPTWLHKGRKGWEGTVFDAGPDMMALHDDGCLTFRTALEFYPGDRVFLHRTVYTGAGWKTGPLRFVTGDPRWCSHAAQNVLQIPSGRIWCMGAARGRSGQAEAWAKYSDDEGFTWHSWRGDGFVATIPALPGKDLRGELFPYGNHVGMLMPKGKWILFDGKAWSDQPASPLKTPVQVVARGKDVYAIGDDSRLAWYDGAAWKTLDLPGREDYPRFYLKRIQGPGAAEWRSQQSFSVCGETTLFVEVDKTGKKILCWRKQKEGEWAGPQEVVSEETPVADLVAPRYSLAGFGPVAYNCWSDDKKGDSGGVRYSLRDLKPWIKVLKVPVDASR